MKRLYYCINPTYMLVYNTVISIYTEVSSSPDSVESLSKPFLPILEAAVAKKSATFILISCSVARGNVFRLATVNI